MSGKPIQEMTLTEKADAAFLQAMKKVIQQSRQADAPIVVLEDGRIKEIGKEHFDGLLLRIREKAAYPTVYSSHSARDRGSEGIQ